MSYYNSNNRWDPSLLSLDEPLVRLAKKSQGRGRQVSPLEQNFIKGPVSVVWLIQAAKLGVKPLLLGLVLWYLSGLRKAKTMLLSNVTCREWGIEPDAKRRALLKLEKARLVAVDRFGRKSPKVTLLHPISSMEMDSSVGETGGD
jgi:hypothetical protein